MEEQRYGKPEHKKRLKYVEYTLGQLPGEERENMSKVKDVFLKCPDIYEIETVEIHDDFIWKDKDVVGRSRQRLDSKIIDEWKKIRNRDLDGLNVLYVKEVCIAEDGTEVNCLNYD